MQLSRIDPERLAAITEMALAQNGDAESFVRATLAQLCLIAIQDDKAEEFGKTISPIIEKLLIKA